MSSIDEEFEKFRGLEKFLQECGDLDLDPEESNDREKEH